MYKKTRQKEIQRIYKSYKIKKVQFLISSWSHISFFLSHMVAHGLLFFISPKSEQHLQISNENNNVLFV